MALGGWLLSLKHDWVYSVQKEGTRCQPWLRRWRKCRICGKREFRVLGMPFQWADEGEE